MNYLKKEYGITKAQLKKLIQNDKLYFVVHCDTTNRVLKGHFYVLYCGAMRKVSPMMKTNVIGMSRVFDLYCRLLKIWELDLQKVGQHYYVLGW